MRHFLLFAAVYAITSIDPSLGETPAAPQIDYVEPGAVQFGLSDPSVIWIDDFDNDEVQDHYAERNGETTDEMRMGSTGKSLRMLYPKGHRGKGGRKLFFGDSPVYPNKAVRKGEVFQDIYWRIYVKHQAGWQGGGPAKLSRATSMATSKWAQAMISHVWSSGESLTLDPASGIKNDQLVTTRYNDFENLRWLGNKPPSSFKIHATEEAGRWVCVEARAKLNTPGKRDGENQLWIDGRLETERTGLDWRGTYARTGINAVFLEAYWNSGSPVEQSRWIDNFVISTRPIGPITSAPDPVVVRTPYTGVGGLRAWQLEVSSDPDGKNVVWRSSPIEEGDRVTVDVRKGDFLSSGSKDANRLVPGTVYFVRARQQAMDSSEWSEWSRWHQPFKTPH
ncbi:MAG: hypothetical protein KDN22_05470 [Verrucomicrobiae bacterium]|nr:hypothetical protein [Verrucomicrobiae bacterium]